MVLNQRFNVCTERPNVLTLKGGKSICDFSLFLSAYLLIGRINSRLTSLFLSMFVSTRLTWGEALCYKACSEIG